MMHPWSILPLVAMGLLVSCAPMESDSVTEYLALVPQPPESVLKWVQVTYPKGVSSASDVQLALLNASVPEIGALYNLDMKLGATMAAKLLGDTLFAYVSKSGAGLDAGTLRAFSKSDGSYRDIDLGAIVDSAMPGTNAAASHTFDAKVINGTSYGFAMVSYTESRLDGVSADAIVAFDLSDGTILKTADGESAFNVLSEAGETKDGYDSAAAVFKIQYFNGTLREEWHGNGVEHFVTKDGTSVLGITHRELAEAVLFKSPYDYTRAQGGGQIVQRFGTAPQYTPGKISSLHYFGVGSQNPLGYFSGGMHNVWYRSESESFPGKETVSVFVNTASSQGKGYAIEFVLNLQEQQPGVVYNDTVFETDYVAAELSYSAPAQGGARAIGKGVLLAMSGVNGPGLEVADAQGASHSLQYPTAAGGQAPNLYDPFVFVLKQ